MVKNIKTAMVRGLKSISVRVESDISNGLPVFELVGFLSSEVKEAKERVRSALLSSGFSLPVKRITVNLSPASIKKSGTLFDLAIALSILTASESIKDNDEDFFVLGELSLDGAVLPVNGVLPMLMDAVSSGERNFIIPKENESEALLLYSAEDNENSIKIYPVSTLSEAIEVISGEEERESVFVNEEVRREGFSNEKEYVSDEEEPLSEVDFSEIHGQKLLKRACEVAVSGMHNFLMIGPPGAGKTLTAKAVPSILPPVTRDEELEIAKIYSVCGRFSEIEGKGKRRPFLSPHHSIQPSFLTGTKGGCMPGSLTLAHKGVLFLDELPEFSERTLEVLRQPLEEKVIKLYHDGEEETYPADFMLICAMNPCLCGNYPNRQLCRCTPSELRRYITKISRPLLDRIDISVEVKQLSFMEAAEDTPDETSAEIRKRVERVHEIEKERYKDEAFDFNSRIPHTKLSKYCPLKDEDRRYMEDVFKKLSLSARAFHRILRVARTIADMDGSHAIERRHLHEAICYRTIDRRFWEEVL